MKKIVFAFFAVAILVGLGACKKETPGDKVDNAIDKAKETTGTK